MEIKDKKVIVVGGSSGIGFGIAKMAAEKGANVIIASRNQDKLKKAAALIGGKVQTHVLNATEEEEVVAFFEKVGSLDHLATSTHDPSDAVLGHCMQPVAQIQTKAAQGFMQAKFWAQYFCAKHAAPKLSEKGSITLTAGVASKRYVPNHAIIAATNAALGAFATMFAREIGPKRVNVVSPGLVDTPTYDLLPKEQKEGFFKHFEQILPVKYVASPADIARAYIYLMENDYHTGDVITPDGGYRISQAL
jgi:NAD(P)-dependent dehydrogenase (short-subunit alcohol dehydrogenase family)